MPPPASARSRQVGAIISRKIANAEWGDGVVPQLAAYLAKTQPSRRGFTARIDLSKVVLTHHNLRNLGKRTLPLQVSDKPKLDPIKESGSGMVREPEKVYMAEVIAKLNEAFGEDTTVDDQLVYVNHVLMGKLMESETLRQQAANNTKEQFGNSPDLNSELMNAVMDAQEAHNTMSTKALNSAAVLAGIKDILLNHSRLWEALRGPQGT